jgi:hypothetical protein
MVLNGAAKLVRAKGRTIVVDQIEYAKTDPLCCPSIHREEHYAFQNGKIVQQR